MLKGNKLQWFVIVVVLLAALVGAAYWYQLEHPEVGEWAAFQWERYGGLYLSPEGKAARAIERDNPKFDVVFIRQVDNALLIGAIGTESVSTEEILALMSSIYRYTQDLPGGYYSVGLGRYDEAGVPIVGLVATCPRGAEFDQYACMIQPWFVPLNEKYRVWPGRGWLPGVEW